MAGSTDWEDLMNGVFGPGGRFRGAAGGKGPEKDLADVQKKLEEAAARTAAAADAAKNTDGARLLRNSEELTRQLEEQSREISRLGQGLAREMERDGLLTPAQAAAAAPAPKDSDAAFERAAQRQRAALAGREDFSAALLAAFRRPFVLGEAGEKPRNVIVLAGKAGRGRHYALTETVKALKEEGLLTGGVAWMDLALYGSPAQEKLFLQDLYAALAGPDPVLAFENAESCHPGCLALLAQLAETGSARLASRYVVQKGMLVETGTALAPGAVGTLSARGKYLVFLCPGGKRALASLLGAAFASAVGDECEAPAFCKEELLAIAGRQLNGLARRTKERLGWTLTAAGEGLADLVAQKGEQGVGRLADFCDRCFAALAEHKLRGRKAAAVTLQAGENGQVLAAFDGGEPVDLLAVLPAEYTGDLAEVKAELDGIIGLREVKDYVLRLEDAVAVQRRRAAAGMKTAGVSMHMIFTGNPGTGKTTIARLVGRYLKAIGALSGGQLVEVSRADLVGRYVGHTAPLTQKVIQSALGGVLFIDEAYSLYRGEQDTFGLEAIDTLVKGMEDHRDELVVILAGYTKEMEEFLQANSGLRSRFPNKIEFPDYTGAELLAITKLTAKGRGYRLAAECDGPLLAFYDRKQAENAAENGNGRLARNTLEAAILNQGRRLAAEPDAALDELRPGDFQLDE
ncbi:MAG TPA: AAA family ATPase [Candidatus Fournierella merdavium]|nr:AAA family ATPase [Candidatus Fournierella merdavium]